MTFDPRLSGMRGLSALSVLSYHLFAFSTTFINFPWLSGLWMGIPVFLMLSMFLLLKTLDNRKATMKGYFGRRIRRIWPVYFAMLGVGVLVYFYLNSRIPALTDIVLFGTFTSYFAYVLTGKGGVGGNLGQSLGPLWTLQLEEFVYLLIPLIHKWGRNVYVAWTMILVGCVWAVEAALLWQFNVIGSDEWRYLYYFPLTWMPAYGLGLLAYLGKVPRLPFPSLIIILCLGIYPLIPLDLERGFLYIPVMLAAASMIAEPPRWLGRFVPLGEVSYGLYAIQGTAYVLFGVWGFLAALPMAAGLELPMRHREILARIAFNPKRMPKGG